MGKEASKRQERKVQKQRVVLLSVKWVSSPFPWQSSGFILQTKKGTSKSAGCFQRALLAGRATRGDLGRNHKPLDRNPTLNLHKTFVWNNSRNVCICIEGKKKNEAWSTAWGYAGSKAGASFLLQAGREGPWAKCFSHSRSVIFKTQSNSCPRIGRQTAIRVRFVIIYSASSVNQGRSPRRIYSRMSGFA